MFPLSGFTFPVSSIYVNDSGWDGCMCRHTEGTHRPCELCERLQAFLFYKMETIENNYRRLWKVLAVFSLAFTIHKKIFQN